MGFITSSHQILTLKVHSLLIEIQGCLYLLTNQPSVMAVVFRFIFLKKKIIKSQRVVDYYINADVFIIIYLHRRTRSLNAPSPVQQFGPCGRIMKNSAMVMQIQVCVTQRSLLMIGNSIFDTIISFRTQPVSD